jgi:hypothetical protein
MATLHRVQPRPIRPGIRRALARAAPPVVLMLVLAPAPVLGQTGKVRVREDFRAEPGGEVIGVLEPGLSFTRASARDGWVEVDVEGWVWMRSLQTTAASGHDLVVAEAAGENLRERPSGAILGRFARGTLLEEQERVPGWVRVGRRGWIRAQSVDAAASAPAPATRPPPASAPQPAPSTAAATRPVPGSPAAPPMTSAPAASAGSGRTAEPGARPGPANAGASRATAPAILAGPGGDTLARIRPEAELQVLARDGSWARVRLEGWAWMPATDSAADLTPVEATPAQLAAEPDRFLGRVVSWDLQFLSLERAERIRTEFFEGEPFLLTRHSAGGYVYVAVAPDRLADASRLVPLERIHVVARVRTPASELTGSPILDLMELGRARDRR